MGGKFNDVKTSPSYGREVAKISFPLILWGGADQKFPPMWEGLFFQLSPHGLARWEGDFPPGFSEWGGKKKHPRVFGV